MTVDLERSHAPGFSPRASGCEPHSKLIETWLGRGRTASAVWQDLVDNHAFERDYEREKRFERRLRGTTTRDPHPRILTEPREEVQVDYGDGPMVRNRETGKYQRVRIFAMTLGFSRKSVWLITRTSNSRIWSGLHERAFRRRG